MVGPESLAGVRCFVEAPRKCTSLWKKIILEFNPFEWLPIKVSAVRKDLKFFFYSAGFPQITRRIHKAFEYTLGVVRPWLQRESGSAPRGRGVLDQYREDQTNHAEKDKHTWQRQSPLSRWTAVQLPAAL